MRELPEILKTKKQSTTRKLSLEEAFNYIRTVKRGFKHMQRSYTIKVMNSLGEKSSLNLPYEIQENAQKYLDAIETKVWILGMDFVCG